MKQQGYVIHFINEAFKHCKAIGATSEAIKLLKETDITDVKLSEAKLTSDKGVVTAQTPVTSSFNEALIAAIAQHRHWIREKDENIPA
jgi:catalase